MSSIVDRTPVRKLPGEYAGTKRFGRLNKHFRLYVKTTGGLPVSVYSVDKTRADGENTALHLGQNAEDLNADATVSRIYTDVLWVMDSWPWAQYAIMPECGV